MEKRVEQEKVVWSAKITKYQIRNILFLLYIYGLIIVIHLTGPQPIQLVLNPFNWSPNSSTGLFSAKMVNFDKTNWYYLFIVHPPNTVNWSQAHSTGPRLIQLVLTPFNWSPNSRYVFSTGKVCSDKGKTRSVEKIEFQCQGALQRPVHAACMRACTLWTCYRFFFLTGISLLWHRMIISVEKNWILMSGGFATAQAR